MNTGHSTFRKDWFELQYLLLQGRKIIVLTHKTVETIQDHKYITC